MLLKTIGFASFALLSVSTALASSECVSPNDDIIGRVPADIRGGVVGEWWFVNVDTLAVIETVDELTFTKKTCERKAYVEQGVCVNFGRQSQVETYVYSPMKNALCLVGGSYDCYKMIGFHCGTGSRPDSLWYKVDTENRSGASSASSGYRYTRP